MGNAQPHQPVAQDDDESAMLPAPPTKKQKKLEKKQPPQQQPSPPPPPSPTSNKEEAESSGENKTGNGKASSSLLLSLSSRPSKKNRQSLVLYKLKTDALFTTGRCDTRSPEAIAASAVATAHAGKKRSHRQPKLYNPQSVRSARQWQSDEVAVHHHHHHHHHSDGDNDSDGDDGDGNKEHIAIEAMIDTTTSNKDSTASASTSTNDKGESTGDTSPEIAVAAAVVLGKRIRRQPKLYNPQLVRSARQWRSDEVVHHRSEEDDDSKERTTIEAAIDTSTGNKDSATSASADKGKESNEGKKVPSKGTRGTPQQPQPSPQKKKKKSTATAATTTAAAAASSFDKMQQLFLSLNDAQFAKFEAEIALERQRRDHGQKKKPPPVAAAAANDGSQKKKKKKKKRKKRKKGDERIDLVELLGNLQNARAKMELALATIETAAKKYDDDDDEHKDKTEATTH
jgi:hypothetical protein